MTTKTTLTFLCAALLFCLPTKASGPDISASELAQHLGVYAWRIPAKNLPDKFTAWVDLVKDGRITQQYLGRVGFQRKGDLIILMHDTDRGIAISMRCGSLFTSLPNNALQAVACPIKHALSQDAGVGSHILCGDYPTKNGEIRVMEKVKDLKSGLVLQIVRDET
ncbi:MAG: hypothetical protein QOD99_1120 [Chthoniobacter sp.]|jgi:hypothetical protein|nr:hypothetical protein [Chthoniobacter sp.]